VSLRELTTLCERHSGRKLEFGSNAETHPADVPWYITDSAEIRQQSGWAPRRSVEQILDDVFRWLVDHRTELQGILY
jgi:CDP-paratose 2-epimerase